MSFLYQLSGTSMGTFSQRQSVASAPQQCFCQSYAVSCLPRQRFYQPPERGFEREILKRIAYWDRLRREKSGKQS